jgi:hypothetical protein
MYNKIDTITDTYKLYNEDRYGVIENCYWILDGALSLNQSKYTDGNTDVDWMVTWWQTYLTQHLNQYQKSIGTILEAGIKKLNEQFSQFININELSKLDRASAGIAIVRINEQIIECFVLGDVEINIHQKNGEIITLVDEKIEQLDSKVMAMIYNNPDRESEIVLNGYTQKELDILREHRMKMNQNDGYAILEHEVTAIRNGIYEEYPLDAVEEMLIMSDGYSAIYNKYKQFSLKELLEKSREDGLEAVLKVIREIEDSDLEQKRYKRLRKHDDATAIYIGK